MAELIAAHTGQTVEQIERDSDRDRWFTAEEAKDYGFVDHVVRSAGQVDGSGGTTALSHRAVRRLVTSIAVHATPERAPSPR